MKIFIEFMWTVAEKIGRKYIWIDLEEKDVKVQDIFQKTLPKIVGKEIGEMLYNMYLNEEVIVVVNGVVAKDPTIKLNDGDRILILVQPLASGG